MSIQRQSKDIIDIYSIAHTRNTEGAMKPTYTYVSSPKVMWLWQESAIDSTKKQDNLGTSATILTDNETTFNLFVERETIVIFQNEKYLVNSKKNTANKGKAFKIMVTLSNIKDMNFVGGLNASGKGGIWQV